MAIKKAATKRSKKTPKQAVKVVKTSSVSSSAATSSNTSFSQRMSNAPVAAFLAEGIGTFLLAAVYVSTQAQPIFLLFGLAAIVLTIGHLSGAHVNPAITFGAWVSRKITTLRAVGYIVFQIFGAMLAFVVLNYLVGGTPASANPATGQAQPAELFKAVQAAGGKEWFAFFGTLLGVGIYSFGVASAIREKKEHFAAAFTVGGGLFIALIIAGQTAILNPAVALTLQSFTALKGDGALGWALSIQIGAPLIGAVIGFLLYDLFRRDVDTTL